MSITGTMSLAQLRNGELRQVCTSLHIGLQRIMGRVEHPPFLCVRVRVYNIAQTLQHFAVFQRHPELPVHGLRYRGSKRWES